MKKDKLYTVNRYNRKAVNARLFSNGGETDTNPTLLQRFSDWMDTRFPKTNAWLDAHPGSAELLNTAANMAGDMAYKGISGGLESGTGNAIDNYGTMLGTGISTVNPVLGAAFTAGSKLVGGLANSAVGIKANQENINKIKRDTAGKRDTGNALASAQTNDSVLDSASNMTGATPMTWNNLYKQGFATNRGKRKGKELINANNSALAFQNHGLITGANTADYNLDTIAKANTMAYGGLTDTNENNDNMGAVNYNFISDYLNGKNKKADADQSFKNPYFGNYIDGGYTLAAGGNIHISPSKKGTFTAAANFARNAAKWNAFGGELDSNPTLFALGGDLQTHGSDWGTGLTEVNAGGSHEENPNGGVQMGVASDGIPNQVEEGESILGDKVYSNRIKITKEIADEFKIPKKDVGKTYAEIIKKRNESAMERPNDPIEQDAFKVEAEKLFDAQETQKQREQMKALERLLESMSPEQQAAFLQQLQGQMQAQTQNPQQTQMIQPDGQAFKCQKLLRSQQVELILVISNPYRLIV